MVNRAPFNNGDCVAMTFPPWRLTTFLTIANPNPICLSVVVPT